MTRCPCEYRGPCAFQDSGGTHTLQAARRSFLHKMNKRHLRRISQYRVKPFAIETSAQFRHGPPPLPTEGPEMLKKETDAVLEYNPKFGDGLTAKDAKDAKTDSWE